MQRINDQNAKKSQEERKSNLSKKEKSFAPTMAWQAPTRISKSITVSGFASSL